MNRGHCELNAKVRERVGKGASHSLRRNNKIPAIIYGDKNSPLSVVLSTREVVKQLYGRGFMTTILTINIDGNKVRVLPKSYQLNPVNDSVIHVDFLRVSENSQVSVQVPVHFINEDKAPGMKQGGILNIVCHEIELHCPADAIPESLAVDLSGLKIGDNVHLSDLALPDNIFPISQHNFTIATIVAPVTEESG